MRCLLLLLLALLTPIDGLWSGPSIIFPRATDQVSCTFDIGGNPNVGGNRPKVTITRGSTTLVPEHDCSHWVAGPGYWADAVGGCEIYNTGQSGDITIKVDFGNGNVQYRTVYFYLSDSCDGCPPPEIGMPVYHTPPPPFADD